MGKGGGGGQDEGRCVCVRLWLGCGDMEETLHSKHIIGERTFNVGNISFLFVLTSSLHIEIAKSSR